MTEQPHVLDVLRSRGLVQDVTDEAALRHALSTERVTFYNGFDPTASSLHAGNLIPIMLMAWLQRAGHRPIVVVGGGTGRIGDPGGRDAERELLADATIEANLAAQRVQFERLLDLSSPDAGLMVDNHEWLGPLDLMGFLRDVGKHFSVNQMVARESVKRRLEAREHGISFTEFSYQLLQAYDFSHLYVTEGCRLQTGGSDQWGNIVAGVDLTRRLHGAEVFGLTTPLLTDAEGKKFGKSVGKPIWLDPEQTSPYGYYQYWLNAHDADVPRYLRLFTFLPEDEVAEVIATHEADPSARVGHRRLAEEATRIVHGDAGVHEAQRATDVLFGGQPFAQLDDRLLQEAFDAAPSTTVARAQLEAGIGLLALMVEAGVAASNTEARHLIEQGAVRLNNAPVDDTRRVVGPGDLASASMLVLRAGKKRYALVRFE